MKVVDEAMAGVRAVIARLDRVGVYFVGDGYPCIGEIAIRKIARAQMRAWRRPFIKIEGYVSLTNTPTGPKTSFSATAIVPARKYLEPFIAAPLLAGERTDHLHRWMGPDDPWTVKYKPGPSVWTFRFYNVKVFDAWMEQVYTDPDIRRALGVPEDAPVLPREVTTEGRMNALPSTGAHAYERVTG